MDPYAVLADWIATTSIAERRALARTYKEWIGKGGFPAKVQFWSNRVFGVPAELSVRSLGDKRLTGVARYQFSTWEASVHPERLLSPSAVVSTADTAVTP